MINKSSYVKNILLLYYIVLCFILCNEITLFFYGDIKTNAHYLELLLAPLLYLVIPALFPKTTKVYSVCIIIVFFVLTAISITHIVLYGADIPQSAYFAIWETNFNEATNYIHQYTNKKTLIINPRGLKSFGSREQFASLLVHETDHVEYIESSKLRRAGLMLKCSPLLNPHISIFSNLPSLTHRLKTMEVCAEKEQIEFHKTNNTESGYEIKHSFVYHFFILVASIFKMILNIFTSIFKSIF